MSFSRVFRCDGLNVTGAVSVSVCVFVVGIVVSVVDANVEIPLLHFVEIIDWCVPNGCLQISFLIAV